MWDCRFPVSVLKSWKKNIRILTFASCITKFLLTRCRFVSQREEGSSVTQRLQFTQEEFSIAIL